MKNTILLCIAVFQTILGYVTCNHSMEGRMGGMSVGIFVTGIFWMALTIVAAIDEWEKD